jgi:hypothetical protein
MKGVIHLIAALATSVNGVEHRYALVNGPEYVMIGRHLFYDYVYAHSCSLVDRTQYRLYGSVADPKGGKTVIVHRCYV